MCFSGELEDVLEKTVKGQFTPPSDLKLAWHVPESLNAVVIKAMSLKQEDRYESVEHLKSEVQNYLLGKTTQAENAGLIKEAKLFTKGIYWSVILSVFSLITIFVLGSIFLFKLQQKNVSLAEEKDRAEKTLRKPRRKYSL